MNPEDLNSYRRRVFKYPLPVESRFMIHMPKGAEILSVGRQGPLPFLWASVDDRNKLEQRMFRTATPGEIFNEERLHYLGHVQLGGEKPLEGWFEWFIYEMEMALPQYYADPISDRFAEDMGQVRDETTDARADDMVVAA
jgi:hypothetical protein